MLTLKRLGYTPTLPLLPEGGPLHYGHTWKVSDSENPEREFESLLIRDETNPLKYDFFGETFYAKDLEQAIAKITEIIALRL